MRENLATNTDTDTHQSVSDTNDPTDTPSETPYDPKAKRRRNPMVELLDELQTVIRNPKSSPQTIEKALSDKKDILFHQAAEKKGNLQDRVSELETENATLLSELTPESTPENPSPEGARQKAEKYDQIASDYVKFKQQDANHTQAVQELKNGYDARLRSWTGFAQSLVTRVFPDAEKLRRYAFRTFLESEFSEEVLSLLGVPSEDAQKWDALRRRWHIEVAPISEIKKKLPAFVGYYSKSLKDKDADAQEFLRTLLQLCGVTDPDQAVKTLRETEATNSPVTARTFTYEPQGLEEKQPADPCAAAQERLIEQVERGQRPNADVQDRDWTLPNG